MDEKMTHDILVDPPVSYGDVCFLRFTILSNLTNQGRNSQNFLGKFVRFFVTLSWFNGVIIHRK